MPEKRLFLIDGNSILYRSYYAIRNLTNTKGFPTNAIYGFLATLKKLTDQEKPDYLGIVFDAKGPTIRHDAFKDYKAQRKPMPEDLVVQLPVLKNVLQAMNIPWFEYEKYEADDVIGTLSHHAAQHRLHTVIVSTDKDLLQLVNDTTSVYNPSKDIHLDRERVKEHFGVDPSQVIDVLSLWGDPSDNIPGVPGVGEKTAKALIKQFGSLDNLLAHLDQVRNERIRKAIASNLDQLKLSRQLVEVEKALSLEFDLPALSVSEPNPEKLIPLLQELGFASFLTEHISARGQAHDNYRVILDENQLVALINQIKKAKRVSLDTETDSPRPTQARLVGMSFSIEPEKACYLPLRHDYAGAPAQIPKERAFALLGRVLSDPEIKKVGQNIKYDMIVLKREGLTLRGLDMDSMILSYLLKPNAGKHNLDYLALSHLQLKTTPYHEVAGKGREEKTLNAVDIGRVAPYACEDADLALRLSQKLWPRVRARGLDKLYRDIELPLIEVLADMEMTGILVDSRALQRLSEELQEDLDRISEKIYAAAGEVFNLNSPQQLGRVLFEKLKLPASRRTKMTRSYSTGLAILQELSRDYPIAGDAMAYRQLAKLKSGYADALPQLINPDTGRIHTSFNQTVAATGRLSSSDPNLQNIPVRGELGLRFRRAFVPAERHLLLSADYSQIELRVLAHLSRDPALIETFIHGRDVHRETAARVFRESPLPEEEKRRRAKIINFSIIYGAAAFSLARELGTSTSEAQEFIDLYFTTFPKVKDYLDGIVAEAQAKGYAETLFGRQRPVPELGQASKIAQQAGRRIALNTPIQGSAADLIKKAMIDIFGDFQKKRLGAKMILQVHDELVFEVPDEECDEVEAVVKRRMENVVPLDVPLSVHLGWGINWAEVK